jgi:hypothetical protein
MPEFNVVAYKSASDGANAKHRELAAISKCD